MINLYIFIVVFNLILFLNLNLISKFLNLYDLPNKARKIHKIKTPIVGGTFLILNLIFFWLLNFYFNIYTFNISPLLIYSFLIFLISVVDDKFDISANIKFLLIGIVVLIFFLLNQDLLIKKVVFNFYYLHIENSLMSLFFSWLCIMLFLNALNLYDGINGQVGIYSIFIFSFFYFNNIFADLLLGFFIPLIFFLVYNLRGKLFLGDSGSFLLGFIISFIIISNNQANTFLNAEVIFLLMFLPGIDMLRLFFERIINKKNPFNADSFHLHHLMMKKFSVKFICLSNIIFYLFLILFMNYISNIYFIILLIFLYFLLIYKFLEHKIIRK